MDVVGFQLRKRFATFCFYYRWVEYTESTEIAGKVLLRPEGPNCSPAWFASVCQFCRKHSDYLFNLWNIRKSLDLWFFGRGRYKKRHAFRHWEDTQHCYSLDWETQRVWDYVGDSYVHRLNRSKIDDKLVKLKSSSRLIGQAEVKLRSSSRLIGDNCKNCEYNDDTDINGTIYNSKLESVFDEYSLLLSSELEKGRKYYETLLKEARENREKVIAEAVEEGVTLKLQDIQLKIEKTISQKIQFLRTMTNI